MCNQENNDESMEFTWGGKSGMDDIINDAECTYPHAEDPLSPQATISRLFSNSSSYQIYLSVMPFENLEY